jgi:hypothetical protein
MLSRLWLMPVGYRNRGPWGVNTCASLVFVHELPRFENSRNVEMSLGEAACSHSYVSTFCGPFRAVRMYGTVCFRETGRIEVAASGSALFNTDARSNRSSRSMVRQAHHGRLDPPLVEGCAPFKTSTALGQLG